MKDKAGPSANTLHIHLFSIAANYEDEHKTKKKELDETVKKNNVFTKEEDKITKERNSNDIKYNKFTLLESQNQERIDNKYKMIVDAAKLAGK